MRFEEIDVRQQADRIVTADGGDDAGDRRIGERLFELSLAGVVAVPERPRPAPRHGDRRHAVSGLQLVRFDRHSCSFGSAADIVVRCASHP
jgi:hypothetical protein